MNDYATVREEREEGRAELKPARTCNFRDASDFYFAANGH